MTILVTGATGNVGGSVLDQLLEAGAPVRATSRNPRSVKLPDGVDVRAADLAEPSSFADTLEGVDKVFLFPNPAGVNGFVDVAKAAGVKHIVLLSSLAAAYEHYGDTPIRMMHVVVEQALERSGIDWTFLQPGSFATNTLAWARSIRKEGVVRLPYPESNVSPIHEKDIAAVAVKALLEDGHAQTKYILTGPESITQRRQAELISAAVERPIEVVELSREAARAEMFEQFGDYATGELIDTMLDYTAEYVGKPADLEDGVLKATGRQPRTFAEWAVDHKADF